MDVIATNGLKNKSPVKYHILQGDFAERKGFVPYLWNAMPVRLS